MVGDQPGDIHFLGHLSQHYGGTKQIVKILSVNEIFPTHYSVDDPDCTHVLNIGQMAAVLANYAILSHAAANQVCRVCDEEKAFLSSVVQSDVTPAGLARSASFPSLDQLVEQMEDLHGPSTPPRSSTPLRILGRHSSAVQREEEGSRSNTPDTPPPWGHLLVQNVGREQVLEENHEREEGISVIVAPRPIRPVATRPFNMAALLNQDEGNRDQSWQEYENGRRTPEPCQRPSSPSFI